MAKTKEELKKEYKLAVVGANQEQIRGAWLKYLAELYKEFGDFQIFHEIRHEARIAGGSIATQYLSGMITAKEFYNLIQTDCAGKYVEMLNQYRVANISDYQEISSKVAIEALQAFKDIDIKNMCGTIAKIWHRFVDEIHKANNLPRVLELKDIIRWESSTEKEVIESNNFAVPMTPQEKEYWEDLVNVSDTSS